MTTDVDPAGATTAGRIEDIYPLTALQQGLLFHSQLDPRSGVYWVQEGWRVDGPLDRDAFVRAWELLFARHGVLRTTVVTDGVPAPLAVVAAGGPLPLVEHDWRGLAPDDQGRALDALLAADRARGAGLDGGRPELARLALARLADDAHQVVFSFHHLLLDGWSATVVRSELLAAYHELRSGRVPVLPPVRPYRDFVAWLAGHAPGDAEAYWRRRLAGIAAPTPLAVDRATGDRGFGAHRTHLPEGVTAAITGAARRHRLTLNTLVQGAWALLLSSLGGEDDVVFGVTTSGRPDDLAGVEAMVGLFINTVPVRVTVAGDAPVGAWLRRLQADQAAARRYEHTPLVDAHAWSDVPAGRPLFDSLVLYENYPGDDGDEDGAGGAGPGDRLELTDNLNLEHTNYPLTVVASPGPRLAVGFSYDRARLDGPTVERLTDRLATTLTGLADALAATPDGDGDGGPRLVDVAVVGEAERRLVVSERNATAATVPPVAGAHALVEAHAAATPDAPAVAMGDEALTYAALDDRAGRLAHHLRALGVGPEVVVGLCLPRGVDAVVAALAVLKAGGAFLPLDPDYPADRLAYMLADSHAPVVVGTGAALDALPVTGARVVELDAPATRGALAAAPPGPVAAAPPGPDGLAYVIYTSGSTGRPKGVQLTHRGAANLATAQRLAFGVEPGDVVLQFAPFSFDAAVWEMLMALAAGAALRLATPEARAEPARLAELVRAHGVTVATVPPSLLDALRPGDVAGLRLLVTAGEALSAAAAAAWGAGRRLVNAYGPTETTVCASLGTVDAAPDGPPPIGAPIANTAAYVVDRWLRPAAVGVPGELLVGGEGLARGYGGRPALTAERFVADPFGAPGGRVYRTGDRARWRPDGRLDFLGRVDHQVKVRGHRVEPGEVEAALRAHPAVAAAVVTAEESGADRRLVAHVVGVDGTPAPGGEQLRAFLRAGLPAHLVPDLFVALDALPLTPAGKVDRAALPAAGAAPAGPSAGGAPRTATEATIAGVWAELLGRPAVGVRDDVFELGAHSLVATRAVARLRTALGASLALADVFDHPTVAAQAALVDGAQAPAEAPIAPRRLPADAPLPLSPGQRRLWFLHQLAPEAADYNVPAALRLRGALDAGALRRALDTVVERHEVLRTRLVATDGVPSQVVGPPAGAGLAVADVSGAPDPLAAAEALVAEDARRPFDLAAGPLLRARLVRLGDGDHVLSLVMHHVVCDEWSAGVLHAELTALYDAFRRGEPSPLAPLPVQYGDVALWQADHEDGGRLAAQLDWWRDRLAGLPALDLPTDRPRPAVRTSAGASVTFAVGAATVDGLRRVGRGAGATLHMTLLAAVAALLGRWSGQDDVAVGTPVAGRDRPEVDGLIGFFVNTLVLRADLSGGPTFAELVERVRATALGAYAHQDVPFERLVEALAPERDRGRHPLFQAMVDYQPADDGEGAAPAGAGDDGDGLAVTGLPASSGTTLYDLTVTLADDEAGGLRGTLEYSLDLFDAATATRLADALVAVATAVAGDGGVRPADVPLVAAGERRRLATGATPPAAVPDGGTPALVAAQVAARPDAVAVAAGGDALTYAALDDRVGRLAAVLRARGVGAESLVGIGLARGVDLVVALLAVWEAGGAYLPLDPGHPPARLRLLLDDAPVAALVTDRASAPALAAAAPAGGGGPGPATVVVDAPDLVAELGAVPASVAARGVGAAPVRPGQLAYVLHTSGSTGRPKGVAVPHGALAHLLTALAGAPGAGPDDVLLAVTTLGFDIAGLELFGPLVAGGRVAVADAATARSPEALAAELATSGATVAQATPATWRMLVDAGWPGAAGLRALCGGEALPPDLAAAVAGRVGELWNVYGPTETTIWSTAAPVRPGDGAPTLGRPIGATVVDVVDDRMAPTPVGVRGEVVIGGPGLARGYLGRPALTAERFVASPFGPPGARAYRTGDRARWRADGDLLFAGRVDDQVKVRGFRIEPGEVEGALVAQPAVAAAAVTAPEDGRGGRTLVAHVVPAAPADAFDAAALRASLAGVLPGHMVPGVVVAHAALPLTAAGKVDRAALPAPDGSRPVLAPFAAPATPTEEVLAGIWAEVIGLDRVGADDDFFALGGHSLLATQVTARARRAFGVDLALAELFDRPTVRRLAALVDAAARTAPRPPLVPRPAGAAPAPLSFAQQRLWFLAQLGPDAAGYAVPLALRLQGPLDAAALGRAVDAVAERHAALRTRLVPVDGEPVQVVESAAPVPLPVEGAAGVDEALALVAAVAAVPFDLAAEAPLRARLVRLAEDDHVLALVVHHVAADDWSVGVLRRDVEALYEAFRAGEPSPLAPLPVQYADVAAWQRAWLDGDALGAEVAWWRDRLAGAPVLDLPTDRPRPAVPSGAGAVVGFAVPAAVAGALRAVARRSGATLFMTLLAALDVVLSRYCGEDDVVVGTPVAGRGHPDVEGLVGVFVNTLALRVGVAGDPTFAELVARARAAALDAYAHQDLPFERLVDELAPERDRSRTPLFPVLVAYQAAEPDAGPAPDGGGLRATALAPPVGTAKFELTVSFADLGGGAGIDGAVEFSTDLFGAATVERLAGHLVTLLEAAAEAPERPLSALPLMAPDEREAALAAAADAGPRAPAVAPATPEPTLHRLVAAQAARRPDAPAVTAGGRTLSYREVVEGAHRLAHHLRALGVGPEVTVGVAADRSAEAVVALLAVLAAGGTQVPLDPAWPPARTAFVLDDSAATLVVGRAAALAALRPPADGVRLVDLDDPATAAAVAARPATAPEVETHPDGLAYVIHTSGSTGRPKGVQVTHRNVTSLLAATGPLLGLGDDDVWAALHSFAFDFSVWEAWGCLAHGGRVVVLDAAALAPDELLDTLAAEGVTVLSQTPSAFAALLAGARDLDRPGLALRTVVFGGEALATGGLAPWLAAHGADRPRLVDMYGITETTVHVTHRPIAAADVAGGVDAIGRPLPGVRAHVVGPDMAPLPVGVPGELLVAGTGVARGYAGRPALTAERFVADPCAADGSRAYRTGDRARRRPDGALEYRGRADDQLAVRGFRIEPGEVEAALRALPGVGAAVVTAPDHGDGDRRLVAHVVPADGAALPPAGELRAALGATLPAHMVPGAIVALAALPLTANGKVDRAALPAPGATEAAGAGGRAALRTPTEEVVAAVWADLLGRDDVGGDDDFFALGGHSLLAVRVMARLRTAFGVELPLACLFDERTVAGLAAAVDAARAAGRVAAVPPVRPGARHEVDRVPLSFAQQRLWFLDQLAPGSTAYNVPFTVRLDGPLDAGALRDALDAVVARHEVLRTRFEAVDGVPHQVVGPPAPLVLASDEVAAGDWAAAERAAAADADRPFDLATGPLVRGRLVCVGDDAHLLALTMHHIVSDEWSAGVLRTELAALYEAFRAGEPSPLAPLPVQYGDVALWQRRWLAGAVLDDQLAWWRARLADLPTLDLPTDRPRPAVRSQDGAVVEFAVPDGVAAGLRALSRRVGATLSMTLLAGLDVVLGRYAGQDDVVVGTPVANRAQPELEGLVGFFVNTLVMRADLGGDPTFAELVASVRTGALDAYARQDVPFEQLVDELATDRDRSRTPLFQVLFNFAAADDDGDDGDHDGPGDDRPVVAKFDLRFMLSDTGRGLAGAVEYATALYDAATVERMAGHLVTLLAAVAGAPDTRLSRLGLAGDGERAAAVAAAAGPAPGPVAAGNLDAAVAAHAAATPAAPAVVAGDEVATYAELDGRAGRLAAWLRGRGVGPEVVVGLCLPRGVEALVAWLAVGRAGGAVLALDPTHPVARQAAALADARAAVVLGVAATLDDLPLGRVVVADLADPATAAAVAGTAPLAAGRHAPHPDQLAYVMSTSGSTGRPKGVLVPHGALAHYAAAAVDALGLDAPGRRVALLQSPAVDFGTTAVAAALLTGGALHVADAAVATDPDLLRAFLAAGPIDVLKVGPSHLRGLAAAAGPAGLDGLLPAGTLVLGGEATPLADARALLAAAAGPVHNHYGPTETTVGVATWRVAADDVTRSGTVPLGRPLAGARLHVLDAHLGPLPVGVPGELYAGGHGVARGYGGRPALTAERFVADPFAADGSRLYRTGDRACRRPDGGLEFLGRLDDQLKVRGHRVEPGEVEAALRALPGIDAAAVGAGDDGRLVAWLVPAPGADAPAADAVRASLARTLPSHMVPGAVVALDALPLGPAGKVDRRRLPAPGADRPALAAGFAAPATATERLVAAVWSEVLGVDRVGADDDFFDLGGHSLLATQVVSRLRRELGVEVTLAHLFDAPTVRGLAAATDTAEPAALPAITPRDRSAGAPVPLSFAQRRLWFLAQLEPEAVDYNVPLALRFDGPLDADALRRALGAVVDRHEVLRTRLVATDGEPHQVVGPPAGLGLTVVDLRSEPAPAARAEALLAADRSTPFDLAAGPLVRAQLLRLGDDEHVLGLVLHHVVSDEWSTGVLRRELEALYEAFRAGRPSPLPPLPIQYGDVAAWQHRSLAVEALDAQVAWWRRRLAGAPPLDLPTDRPRPAVASSAGGAVEVRVPGDVAAGLRAVARRAGASLHMALLAGFSALLGRYAGQDDVVVGTPVANRNRAEVEGLIGFFVNTLVMRTDLAGDPTFAELLARVRAGALGAHAHQDAPFEQLVEALAPDRDRSRTPLFQVLFDYAQPADAAPEAEPAGGDGGRLGVTDLGVDTGTTLYDLTLVLADEGDGGLAGVVEFRTDLFDRATVERLAGHLVALLAAVAGDDTRHIAEVALTSGDEAAQLAAWAGTGRVTPAAAGAHLLVAAHAAATPRAPAVVASPAGGPAGAAATLDHGELDARANRLAHHLRARGVGPETVVGLCLERTVDLPVAVLAVWKAGGAYLPLDPAYPAARLGFLVADGGAALVVGHAAALAALDGTDDAAGGAGAGVPRLALDDPTEAAAVAARPATAPDVAAEPGRLACVIHTSGSTGRPKGTLLTHANLLATAAGWAAAYGDAGRRARWLTTASAGFDVFTGDLVRSLGAGGTLVVAPTDLALDVAALARTLDDHAVTAFEAAPRFVDGLAGHLAESGRRLDALRLVAVTTDVWRRAGLARAREAFGPGVRLATAFGLTEATVDSTIGLLDEPLPASAGAGPAPDGPLPIGRPLAHARTFVLDGALAPAPVGVPGELYVGGPGVARGYGGRPALTASRFVAAPAAAGAPGERLYRTGDRARWAPDGQLEFLGRSDDQLNLRGYRVEPGEVEAALLDCPGVAAAAVAAHDGLLVAYVVPATDTGTDADGGVAGVRARLAGRLPAHLVPGLVVELGDLPLTPHGKLDRRALPAPGRDRTAAGSHVAPATVTEELVAGAWAEVLGVDRVGATDDFFALGGHSLLATQVVSRLRRALGVEVPLAALFDHPTVAGLAAVADATGPGLALPPITARPDPGGAAAGDPEPLPLTFAQQRLWFVDQLDPGTADHNVPAALRFEGALDAGALAQALEAIVARHESLRTRLVATGGVPHQVVGAPGPVALPVVDLSGADDPLARAEALVDEDAAVPFDLAAGPLFRARLLRLGAEDHVLGLVLHHVVADEWSLAVLGRELRALYGAFRAGRPSPLAPLPIQYADVARWERRWLEGDVLDAQLAWWRARLAGAPTLDLPTDRPRPAVRSSAAGTVEFALDGEVVAGLRAVARRAGATLFMTLLAGLDLALGRYAGQDDVVVGTPVAGRNRAEVEGLIGCFVNTLALRVDLGGDPTFAELVARARRGALGAYAHQDVPFERLVDELAPERDRSRTPLFQVLFNFEQDDGRTGPGGPGDDGDDGLAVSGLGGSHRVAVYDLSVVVADDGSGRLAGAVDYATDLFDAATVERLVGHLVAWLGAAAAGPDRRLSELTALDAGERARVEADGDGPATDVDAALARALGPAAAAAPAAAAGGVHLLVAAHAAHRPGATAVVAGADVVTYGELDDRARRLAALLRQRGVGPGTVVALCLDRGADVVVGALAVLYAGGAYLPLDTEHPGERLAYLLDDSGAAVVVGRRARLADIPAPAAGPGAAVVALDDCAVAEALAAVAPVAPAPAADGELACVTYTSGSTGRPKGVLVTHGGLRNVLAGWLGAHLPPRPGLRWLSLTSVGFDVFTGDLVRALATGGTLVVAPTRLLLAADELVATLDSQAVAALELSPRVADELVDVVARTGRRPAALRLLVVTTDTWREAGAARARRVLGEGVRLLTGFGLTEASVDSTAHDVGGAAAPAGDGEPGDGGPGDRATAIGRPLANVGAHVVGPAMSPVPVGVVGELLVSGAGLARGYGGRPALTAGRFVADPIAGDGGRAYRTGDRARWRPDGTLEFLGRADDQVNLRGHRIEPGEVEAALVAGPGVAAAVVVARGVGDADRRLVAYVVPADASAGVPPADELRARLGRVLPDALVPSVYVPIDAVPLTAHGKVDRAALPEPAALRPDLAARYVVPSTPTEELVAGAWAEVLGVDRVGAGDDFFALGGHSLLATQVVSRLRDLFGAEVPVAALFDHPTVAGLARLVDAGGGGAALPPVTPRRRTAGERVPLSFGQQRLWFLDQLEPGSVDFNLPLALRFRGPFDVAAMEAALAAVVARHEVLRTRLVATGGVAHQVVAPPGGFRLAVDDVAGDADPEARAAALVGEDAARAFDLAAGPLFRARLVRLADDDHVLATVAHHAVSDEWSAGILHRELEALYEAFRAGEPSPLPPVPVQYGDVAVWQRTFLEGDVLDAQLAWWRDRLAGAPALALPTDRPRPAVRSSAGAVVRFAVPAPTVAALREVARAAGATMFMTLLAAVDVVLGAHAGADDVVVGTPVAGRNRAEVEGLIGFFVNTLVLRADLSGDPTFAELVGRVRDEALGAYAHQDVPFERLVDELAPDRDRSRTPLYQALFNYEPGDGGPAGGEAAASGPSGEGPALEASGFATGTAVALTDVRVVLADDGDGLAGVVEYSTDLFDAATMQRLADHVVAVLASVAERPGAHLSAVALMGAAERDRALRSAAGPALVAPAASLPELVGARAAEHPGAPALVAGDAVVTYAELECRSGALAHRLRARGVTAEVRVGVCLPRGVDAVVTMLAVLRAGGAYVPLDPDYPARRLELMVADSGAAVVVGRGAALAAVPAGRALVVDLDVEDAPAADAPPLAAPHPAQLAYVMYTSGSTGRPKGIGVTHADVVALVRGGGYVDLAADDVVVHASSVSFDASTFEVWGALANGAALAVVDREVLLAPAALADELRRRRATVLFLTPALFGRVAAEAPHALAGLRHLVVGGEALDPVVAGRVLGRDGRPGRLVNGYGPTETTTFATWHEVAADAGAGAAVPIGRPLPGMSAHVTGPALAPVPDGVAGELYLAGAGVARGYVGRPALTAERFVADPFAGDGGRMYRTGDRAARAPDGPIAFLGRVDQQVKVRGHRIEPGEVEAALVAHPAVAAAVVTVHAGDDGDRRLVGHLVPADADVGVPSADALRAHLGESLPAYLVPGLYVEVAALPLTPNGKVDRAALPAPDEARPALAAAFVPADGPTEEAIAGVWAEVLGVERVGATDDFFDLGGHSLLATQVVARLRAMFDVDLALADLFDQPTVGTLAPLVEAEVLRQVEALSDEDALLMLDPRPGDPGDGPHGGAEG